MALAPQPCSLVVPQTQSVALGLLPQDYGLTEKEGERRPGNEAPWGPAPAALSPSASTGISWARAGTRWLHMGALTSWPSAPWAAPPPAPPGRSSPNVYPHRTRKGGQSYKMDKTERCSFKGQNHKPMCPGKSVLANVTRYLKRDPGSSSMNNLQGALTLKKL